MTNQFQIELLRLGGAAWNRWRERHPGVDIDLRGASLNGAKLSYAALPYADLSNADLSNADLPYADLSNADLSNAKLLEARLFGTDLTNANLMYADLTSAHLSRASLTGAFVSQTDFNDLDLHMVKGLETIRHEGSSGITTSTLERSHGDIPEAFLRGAGLSDLFIEYAHSLTNKPIAYYTCFISYSSRDQDFAERLYADLQSKGVRCWYAPEDIDMDGDSSYEAIRLYNAIRLYDKFLVIFSQHSVQSSWVEHEVRAALEKEGRFKGERQDNTVLFPVKIDQAIEDKQAQWVALIHRTRPIGDFTGWKDHDSYQKAFQRLLRDLQASAEKEKR